MGLINRVILNKLSEGDVEAIRGYSGDEVSDFAAGETNQSASGMTNISSGMNSIEKQMAGGCKELGKTSPKHQKEIKQYREYNKRIAEEKEQEIDTKVKKKKKVLSKQTILPESMKKELEVKKEIKEGNDISPII